MKIQTFVVVLVTCFLAVSSVALAQEREQSIPNLLGTWVSTGRAHSMKAIRSVTVELRITEQDGAHFRGVRSWRHAGEPEPGFHAGGKVTSGASEPVLGVIGFDGKSIYMVEQDDWGSQFGRLVDPDTIEYVYMEAGPHAAIARHRLKRQK